MLNTAETVFEAIDNAGYAQDEFITEQITVAYNKDEFRNIHIVGGDYRGYFYTANYDYIILLSDGDTVESIEAEIDRLDTIERVIGY